MPEIAVRVGLVRGAFGVAGAVKVEPLTDFDDRFEPGSELRLAGQPRRVEWTRHRPDHLVVKLSGIDDRNAAERYGGLYLEVPAAERKPPGEAAWYADQLVGLRVSTESGRDLGEVVDVLQRPANDIWVTRGEREVLVPAVKDAVISVDVAGGRITVADWLLDVEEA